MVNHNPVVLLVVEDDDGHSELIQECFEQSGITNELLRFRDGQAAWDFLSGQGAGPHIDPSGRYLLLLDIRMPRMNGVEVLKRVKSSDTLKKIPVIMLTTTDDPAEIEECYHLGCSSYVTKPIDFQRFTEVLTRIGLFLAIIQVAPPGSAA